MKRLQIAFSKKEKAEGLLANLEGLKEEGHVEDDQYEALKGEYTGLLEEGNSEIEAIKEELRGRLEARRQNLDTHTQELKSLEARIKVGEIPKERYEGKVERTRSKVEDLQEEIANLEGLLQADSSADVGGFIDVSTGRQGLGESLRGYLPSLESLGGEATSRETGEIPSSFGEITVPRTKLIGLIGGLVLLISVFLPWASITGMFSVSYSGIALNGAIGAIGIISGVVCIAATFLTTPNAKGLVHISMGVIALLVMLAVWFSQPTISTGEIPSEYWEEFQRGMEEMIQTGPGFYLYILSSLAVIVGGIIEAREGM